MADLTNRMIAVTKNLYDIELFTSKEAISCIDSNKTALQVLSKVNDDLSICIKSLPTQIKHEDKNLIDTLKYMQNNCKSIVQALEDKACKPRQAIRCLSGVNAKVVLLQKSFQSNIDNRLVRENADTITTLAVEEYNLEDSIKAMSDLNKKIAELNVTENPYFVPQNTHDAAESKYDDRVQQNTSEIEKTLTKIEGKAPKSIKIGSAGYIMVKAPLLCITQYFVPDSTLKKSGIRYLRLSNSLNAGYAPGLGREKGGDTSSYIIYENQILVAFPIRAFQESDFDAKFADILHSLEQNLGKLVIVGFGKNAKSVKQPELVQKQHFVNKKYPGLGFIWIIPSSMLSNMGSIKYSNVDIAVTNLNHEVEPEPKAQQNYYRTMDEKKSAYDKKNTTELLEKTKKEQEADAAIADQLSQAKLAKEKATKTLQAKYDKLDSSVRKTFSESKDNKLQLDLAKQALQLSETQLAKIASSSSSYKGMLAAKSAAQLAVNHFDAIQKEIASTLSDLRKTQIELKAEIDIAMAKFYVKRKKLA